MSRPFTGFFMSYLPVNYIQSIRNDLKQIRAFAFYVKLKNIYKSNGIIYNYNPKTLSYKIKVSVYLIKNYVRTLEEMDIVSYRDNHLCLIGLRKLAMTQPKGLCYRKNIEIHGNDSIQTIVTKLRFLKFKDTLIDSYKWYNIIRNEIQKSDRLSIKKLKREYKKYLALNKKQSKRKCDEVIHAGYRKISKITGLPICQVKKFLLTIRRWEYIKDFKEMVEKFGTYVDCGMYYKNTGSRYYDNGYLYTINNTTYVSYGTAIIPV